MSDAAVMNSPRALDEAWLAEVQEKTVAWLSRLQRPERTGWVLPCEHGTTAVGREMGLGFACFALRTLRMLGAWNALPAQTRADWVRFISNYQEPGGEGAFRDEPELRYISQPRSLLTRIADRVRRRPALPSERALLLAETKQAIATLDEVDAQPARPFTGFPQTPAEVRAWLERQDWTRPWGAGGQSGALVCFLATQARRILPQPEADALLQTCRDFFAELADHETGAYFRGPRPAHGELINGAMKVLICLDWLGVRPHYAEQLIATTIAQPPQGRGCHLVDAIYVLHQSVSGEASQAVRVYCLRVFDQIRAHFHATGGFSFYVGQSQTSYYGVPITRGHNEADVQGTCLLSWALAMTWRMVDPANAKWDILRP
jgi:hypothetical protein